MAILESQFLNSSNTSTCNTYAIPTISDYLKATNEYGIALLCAGGLAVIVVILMFIDTLKYVMQNTSSTVKACTASVIAVYPATCLLSFCAILVPRSQLLSEAITQGIFMSAMYQLFCLFVSYCGSSAELVKIVKPTKLTMKAGPCCCLPCCGRLPQYEVTKKTVKYLKLLVLQLPLVQGLVYFILLVMWAEAESLYQVNYLYLQPIVLISILFGIWGIIMTIKILKFNLNPEFLLVKKFIVLQMVLLFSKFQGITMRILIWCNALPCNPPITPQVYGTLIQNSLMMVEMVILGFFARNIYKRSLPNIENTKCKNTGIISTLGSINNLTDKNVNNNTETPGYTNKAYDVVV